MTAKSSIDLNADVGEGLDAADAAILPLISSANIACGGHAGDLRTMRQTVALALRSSWISVDDARRALVEQQVRLAAVAGSLS